VLYRQSEAAGVYLQSTRVHQVRQTQTHSGCHAVTAVVGSLYILYLVCVLFSWSLQQKLMFNGDPESKTEGYDYARLKMDGKNTLLMSTQSHNSSATYIFKTFTGRGWSLQQKLVAWSAQVRHLITSLSIQR
jgi:hypothetical protein